MRSDKMGFSYSTPFSVCVLSTEPDRARGLQGPMQGELLAKYENLAE